jgi:hypothetical protein
MIVVVPFRSSYRRGYLPVYLSAFASRKDTSRQQEIEFKGKSSRDSGLLGCISDTSRHGETLSDAMGDGVNVAARLEGIAKPGAICLSEHAYWQVKSRLDLKVSDLGPTQLKNIDEPIRVYSLEVGVPAQAKFAQTPAPEKSAPPRLSMVVLPFANIGGGAEQEAFVDGVTESLTTDLSRIRGSFVIGRNTAFTYKGKDRIRAMDFRAVEETDQTRQTLLEVYCAVVLETPYNDFGTH